MGVNEQQTDKAICFREVNQVAQVINKALIEAQPDRLVAVCALLELAIATLNDNEPIKQALTATYTKHVKPQKKSIILPFGAH